MTSAFFLAYFQALARLGVLPYQNVHDLMICQRLAHIQMNGQQYNLPPFSKRLCYRRNRTGVVEHFADLDPAVPAIIASDLATIDHLDEQIRKLELTCIVWSHKLSHTVIFIWSIGVKVLQWPSISPTKWSGEDQIVNVS